MKEADIVKAIMKYPFLVTNLAKEINDYYFFWKLAISICYKVLCCIDEDKKELFPLIEKAIHQEPLAIFHVDSRISIYSKLCNIAYNKLEACPQDKINLSLLHQSVLFKSYLK